MTLKKLVGTLALLCALLNITSGSIPSAPRNLTIDNVGSRSINISWTRPAQDGNSSQLNYAVFYKGTGGKGLQVLEVRGDTKASISAKPYRTFNIYVMAGNKDGYGPPTLKKNVTTKQEEPEKCPIIDYTDERDVTDLRIGWKEVAEEDQNGIILGYVIFYISKSSAVIKNVTVNDPNVISYTFSNFSKEENYGFRVAAFTSVGLCKGYENLPWDHELEITTAAPATSIAATTAEPVSTAPAATTAEPVSTAPATAPAATTAEPVSTAPATAPAATAEPVSTAPAKITSALTEGEDTTTQLPSKGGCKTEEPTQQGETLARTSESNWWIYVLIAMAVIVAIMGITIFLLIWQLYKNHRFYKLRKEQYSMNNTTPNMGRENEAHDAV